MAKVKPNHFIESITGKVCQHSKDYYSCNKCSGVIHTGKICNPYQGPATQKQLAQQTKFKTRQLAIVTWLNNNKEIVDAEDGTILQAKSKAYKECEQLRKSLGLSSVRSVVNKYMDDLGVVTLPSGDNGNTGGGGLDVG